jgi:pimeloyl-ACP methyl ester carboxylesterase
MLWAMKWLAAIGAALALAGSGAAATPGGTWTGTFRLPAAGDPVIVSVDLARGAVVLGAGHAPLSRTAIRRDGARVRFSVPGRPALAFGGRLRGKRLTGTVRQGLARGSFSLSRGPLSEHRALGVYRLASGRTLGVFGADGPRIGVVFEDDELRGLFRKGAGRYDVGSGWGVRGTPVGEAVLDGSGGTWRGEKVERLAVRTLEVRFGALAGTLWIPAGTGKHAAVAIAHGSGVTPRQFAGALPAYFASRGLVVLAYDKRGTGQSAGPYPGEAATTRNIDLYARDAAAAVRFLAAQPEVDRAKAGLAGQSQAGWVMALAAAREPAVRWFFSYSGPSVTQGETDEWGQLAGRGGPPAGTDAEIEAQIRQHGPSGFDPMPSLRKLSIPLLYLYGANDRHVPARLSVERLGSLGGDLKVVLFPRADHFLIESEHGSSAELAASHRYAAGMFETLDAWLASNGLRG